MGRENRCLSWIESLWDQLENGLCTLAMAIGGQMDKESCYDAVADIHKDGLEVARMEFRL